MKNSPSTSKLKGGASRRQTEFLPHRAMVTCQPHVFEKQKIEHKPLREALSWLKDKSPPPETFAEIERLKREYLKVKSTEGEKSKRYKELKEKCDTLKARLPCIRVYGICNNGMSDSDVTYNGLLMYDFDELLDKKELDQAYKQAAKWPYRYFIEVSASGTGFKLLAFTNATKEQLYATWQCGRKELETLVGHKLDSTTYNPNRLWFPGRGSGEFNEKAKRYEAVKELPKATRPETTTPQTQDDLQAQWTADLKAEGAKIVGEGWEPYKDGVFKLELECPEQGQHKAKKHCVAFGNPDGSLVVTCFSSTCKESHVIKELNRRVALRRLLRQWVYVVKEKQFYNTTALLSYDKEEFNDEMRRHWEFWTPVGEGKKQPNPHVIALGHSTLAIADSLDYWPQHPPTYTDEGVRYFNIWRQQTLIKAVEGDVTPLLKHSEMLFPVEEERRLFLEYFAANIQEPGRKALYAMLVQGVPGDGKSFFGDLARDLLGRRNVKMPSNEAIHDKYTSWAKNCSLIVIEELMARGRLDLMNKLKPLITQGNAGVRDMYRVEYEGRNTFNFLLFTNYKDAIVLDKDDRRYCVLFSALQRKEDKPPNSYYNELWDWKRANLPALLYYFEHLPLANFNWYGDAPMTAAKSELIGLSAPGLEQWMRECIETEYWPFQSDIVASLHLLDCLPNTLRNKNISLTAMGNALTNVGAQKLNKVVLTTGNSVRPWSVRRHNTWKGAAPGTIAQEYEKWADSHEPRNPIWDAKHF